MASTANFAATPNIGQATISVANTSRDGTGTMGTIFTAGANGSRLDTIHVQATAATTAGMVRIFTVSSGGSPATTLYMEIPISAVASPSGTVSPYSVTMTANGAATAIQLPLFLPAGWSVKASTHNAESFNVFGIGGNF